MNGLKIFKNLSYSRDDSSRRISNALSVWRKQLLAKGVVDEINTLLPSAESESNTMKVHDRELVRQSKSHRRYHLKLENAKIKYSSSVEFFSTSILGCPSKPSQEKFAQAQLSTNMNKNKDNNNNNTLETNKDAKHNSQLFGSKYHLPESTRLMILYPTLSDMVPDRDDQIKRKNLGKMLMELACWTYSMKNFRSSLPPVPGSTINNMNFEMLGTISPSEEVSWSAENDYVRYSKAFNVPIQGDTRHHVQDTSSTNRPRKATIPQIHTADLPNTYRYSPDNPYNLCRPNLLKRYVRLLGLYDLMIIDVPTPPNAREGYAVSALYKTVGELARLHGAEVATDFVQTRLIEGSNGILELTSNS